MIYQTTHNTSVEQFIGGNLLYYTFMIYTYTSKSMLAEVSRSAFEGLVYKFSSPVDQARVCFVHKVYKFLHVWVYPRISWQQFGTIGIIQRADKHEMELVFNLYVANLTFTLCIRYILNLNTKYIVMGDWWVGGPMRWGTNEMGTNEMGAIGIGRWWGDEWKGGPKRWGTSDMGDQWNGGPMSSNNVLGDQWVGGPMRRGPMRWGTSERIPSEQYAFIWSLIDFMVCFMCGLDFSRPTYSISEQPNFASGNNDWRFLSNSIRLLTTKSHCLPSRTSLTPLCAMTYFTSGSLSQPSHGGYIILRSTVRTSDISWFSLPLLLQNWSQTDTRIGFAQKTASENSCSK